jgi:hypothetical protein
MRPVLRPGLRHAWRTADTLQVGIDVPRPIVVSRVPVLAHALLPRLDGVRDRVEVVASLVGDDLDPSGGMLSHEVLDQLISVGAVVDADEWSGETPLGRRRALSSSRVVIRGAGRLGGVLARVLVSAGIGSVSVDDARAVTPADLAPGGYGAEDVGRPRSRISVDQRPRPLPPPEQRSLVVVTDDADLDVECRRLSMDVEPHLVVTGRELIGRVGPLVEPGRTSCHFCLELTRRDLDPHYPQIWRQSRRHRLPPCGTLLAGLTAHVAAAQVVEWVAGGRPAALDGIMVIETPDGCIKRVPARAHPECGCTWPGSAT